MILFVSNISGLKLPIDISLLLQVLAEKGGSLNYDELVVYRNDAIRPSFLVMYDA